MCNVLSRPHGRVLSLGNWWGLRRPRTARGFLLEPLRAVRGTVRSLVTAASLVRCSDEGPTDASGPRRLLLQRAGVRPAFGTPPGKPTCGCPALRSASDTGRRPSTSGSRGAVYVARPA